MVAGEGVVDAGEAAAVSEAAGGEGGVLEPPAGVGEARGIGGKAGEEGSPPLTSGNLMQLQLASLSPTGEGCATGSVIVGGGVGVVAGAVSSHGKEDLGEAEEEEEASSASAAAAAAAAAGTLSPASGACTPSMRAVTPAGGSTETLAEAGGVDGGESGGGGEATMASPSTATPGAAAAAASAV